LSKWRRILDIVTPVRLKIGRLEASAEAAYTAMYDAAPHNVKDCYEDAMLHLHEAQQLAEKAHMRGEAARLKGRSEHIRNVYDRQFRNVGR
jgi:hypothetical protein